MASNTVLGTYVSPSGKKDFDYKIPALPDSPTTKETAAYLATLRKTTLRLQNEINAFLTQRMEEDKAPASGNGNGISTIDEQKEEDNYGEEVEEDV